MTSTPFLTRHSGYLLLALFCSVVMFDLYVVKTHSLSGTDDLMARLSAESPSFTRMLSLLRDQPLNVDAPFFAAFTWLAARLPINTETAIVLPSALGVCLLLVFIFLYLRDRFDLTAAIVATGFLTLSRYLEYGAKARPYGLLLGLTATSIFCWSKTGGSHKTRWQVALGISLTLLLLTHYFAVFCLLALCIAQLIRNLRHRKADWHTWLAMGIAVLLFIPVYRTFAVAGEAYRAHPFEGMHRRDLLQSYQEILRLKQTAFLLLVAIAISFQTVRNRLRTAFPPEDLSLALTLFLIPALVFAIAVLYTHTYSERYGLCGLLGMAILVCIVLTYLGGAMPKVLVATILVLVTTHQVQYVRLFLSPASSAYQWPVEEPAELASLSALPLITPDFDYAMRVHLYAPKWLSAKLIMVANQQSMLRIMGTDAPALVMSALHRWEDWPTEDLYAFIKQHHQFLLYGEYWGLQALQQSGAHIQQLPNLGPHHLYLVKMPD